MSQKRVCGWCSAEFESIRPNAVYCSDAHRKQASRARRKALLDAPEQPAEPVTSQSPPADQGVTLEQATRDDLVKRQLDGTPVGVAVLALARQIDAAGARDGLSAMSSATKTFADVVTKVLGQGKGAGDRGDELAEQRAKRRREARGG